MTYRSDLDALGARTDALDAELAQKTKELEETSRLLAEAKARAKLPVLDNIRVASPCRADWNQMVGDERARHCDKCEKQVFNISDMTRAEAEALIIEKNGNLCARYYRRNDGTILTADCRVGAAAARNRKLVAAGAAAMVLTGIGYKALHREPKLEMDAIDITPNEEATNTHVTGVAGRETPPPKPVELPQRIKVMERHMDHTMGVILMSEIEQ